MKIVEKLRETDDIIEYWVVGCTGFILSRGYILVYPKSNIRNVVVRRVFACYGNKSGMIYSFQITETEK